MRRASELERLRGRRKKSLREATVLPHQKRLGYYMLLDIYLEDDEAERLARWGAGNRALVERLPGGTLRYASFRHHKVVRLPARSRTSFDA